MQTLSRILASALALTLASAPLYAQQSDCKDCVRQKKDLAGFTRVKLELPGRVEIRRGATFSVEVEARPEDQSGLNTHVAGNTLVIEATRGNHKFKDLRWYVTMPSIDNISVQGTGNIVALDEFTAKELTLEISGTGNIKGSFTADRIKTEISGTGTVDLIGKTDNLVCDISGAGNVKGSVEAKHIKVDISGTGSLKLNGHTDELNGEVSGAGNIQGLGLETRRAILEIGGTGNVETSVSEELKVEIAGAGSVRYKGNPSKVQTDVSGVGRIVRL